MTIKEFIHTEYQKAYDQTKPGNIYPVYPSEYLFPLIQEYVRIKCLEAIRNTRYKCENIIEEWTDTGNPNIKIALTKIEDLKDEELLPTF